MPALQLFRTQPMSSLLVEIDCKSFNARSFLYNIAPKQNSSTFSYTPASTITLNIDVKPALCMDFQSRHKDHLLLGDGTVLGLS